MPDEQIHDDLSLEQIEADVWGDAPADATRLMTTVHELRRKPVGTLSPEDLRVLVAQQVGLDVLIPRVLTQLEHEPLLEGDFYPGDLLVAVLRVPSSYWAANPTELVRVERVIASIDKPDTSLKADIDTFREAVHS